MSNPDWYLDPPDTPEAVICEHCGQEKTILRSYNMWTKKVTRAEFVCNNDFCPENFTGEAKEMAEKLVEALDTVSRLEGRVKFLSNRLKRVDPEWK